MLNFKTYISEGYNGDGDCMEAAVNLMMRFHSDFFGKRLKAQGSPVLVHALVRGHGILKGKRFPHAWVEDGNLVIDQSNGNDIRMEKRVYYALGGIKPNEKGAYVKYAYSDMKKKLVSTGHYGHWDLDEKLEETVGIGSLKRVGRQKKRVNPKLLMALDEGIVSGVGGGVKKIGQATANVTRVSWNTLKCLGFNVCKCKVGHCLHQAFLGTHQWFTRRYHNQRGRDSGCLQQDLSEVRKRDSESPR
jgi:hypothetical protein